MNLLGLPGRAADFCGCGDARRRSRAAPMSGSFYERKL